MDDKYRFNPQTGEKEIFKGYHKETGEPIYVKYNDNKGLVSFILGIISLVTFLLPLSITGLIFGIKSKINDWKKVLGIIINSVALFLQLLLILIIVLLIIGIKKISNNGIEALIKNYIADENITGENFDFGDIDFGNISFDDIGGILDKYTNSTVTDPVGYYICYKENSNQKLALELEDDYEYSYIDFNSDNSNYQEGNYSYEKIDPIDDKLTSFKINFVNEETNKQNSIIFSLIEVAGHKSGQFNFENEDIKYDCIQSK